QMHVEQVRHGVKVTAYDGARPFVLLADHGEVEAASAWHHGFTLAAEAARGLDAVDEHLHIATFHAPLALDRPLTLVLSAEVEPALDGAAAAHRREHHETDLLARWTSSQRAAKDAPAFTRHCVRAAARCVAPRPTPAEPDGATVIAGYHWFGDWGRDTMISLPGLTLTTGRPEIARRIFTCFARFVDRG